MATPAPTPSRPSSPTSCERARGGRGAGTGREPSGADGAGTEACARRSARPRGRPPPRAAADAGPRPRRRRPRPAPAWSPPLQVGGRVRPRPQRVVRHQRLRECRCGPAQPRAPPCGPCPRAPARTRPRAAAIRPRASWGPHSLIAPTPPHTRTNLAPKQTSAPGTLAPTTSPLAAPSARQPGCRRGRQARGRKPGSRHLTPGPQPTRASPPPLPPPTLGTMCSSAPASSCCSRTGSTPR
jgi:hypothetical protein